MVIAQTNLVPKHYIISNPTRKACLEKLAEPVSLKHIANELSTSDSFVGRQLLRSERDFKLNFHCLPKPSGWMYQNRYRRYDLRIYGRRNSQIDGFSFISNYSRLEKYFKRYDQTTGENVKIIVTDMNYTYPNLTRTIFPNAIVVKFHIINALNRAFHKTRVRIMKKFTPSSREFKALKRYWKLLLVSHEQLDFEQFHKWTYFPYWVTVKDIVDRLLNLDPILKQTYDILNKFQTALQHKEWNNYNAAFWNTEGCSDEMLSTLKILGAQHSNGPLEGLNNKIKAIKKPVLVTVVSSSLELKYFTSPVYILKKP